MHAEHARLIVLEQRFRDVMGQSPFSMQLMSGEGEVLMVNPAWERMWGKTIDMLEGYNILHDQQLLELGVMPYIHKGFAGEAADIPDTIYNPENAPDTEGVCRNHWIRGYIYPLKDADGRVQEVVLMHQDVSEQVNAVARMRRLATALDETTESVVITGSDGLIEYVNRAFEAISGYAFAELQGKSPGLLKSGRHSDAYYRLMWETISQGEPWAGSFINRSKTGALYEVEQTISPIHKDSGAITGYVSVQRDVTEQRERQTKLEHMQRLESLGILAGGIAHDFNNLLTAIMGNVALAKLNSEKNEPVDTQLGRIESASTSAAQLCKQMLAYSGQGAYAMHTINLAALAHDMTELLQASMTGKARLTLQMDASGQWLQADEAQIQQVIMNLVINASEAIDASAEGGHVEVSVSGIGMAAEDFSDCLTDSELTSGRYACLRVSDNGCGMDEETRLKLFDPFFTTKFTGRGLGMSAVLGIIYAHKGAVRLASAVREGTTFEVYFPSVDAPSDQGITSQSGDEMECAPAMHGIVALLIDDEEYILESTGAMLEDAGVTVLTAASAAEGIACFAANRDSINLVLLDMTMLEMDGLSCAHKLRDIDPEAVIVLSSGYSEEDISNRVSDIQLNGFLQKPYSYKALVSTLTAILSA